MEKDAEELIQESGKNAAAVTEKRSGSFLSRLMKGFVIGVAGILPGASGGVLAVSMGVYKPVLDAVYGFFKSPKANILFLLPIGIGGAAGILSFSRLVEFLLDKWEIPVMYCLIGLVIGGIPSLIGEANERGFKKTYPIGTVLGLLFVLGLGLLDRLTGDGSQLELPLTWFTAMLCGGILAVGTVIPGISTSFILIYLGLFAPMLKAFNSFDMPMLLSCAAGVVIIGGILIIGVKKVFDRHYSLTCWCVLGFLAGSCVLIFPGVRSGWLIALDIALAVAGFFASYFLSRPSRGIADNGKDGIK